MTLSFGDGTSNDTDQIQAGVSATPAGGVYRLAPNQTYRVDGRGISIPSGVTLELTGARVVSLAGPAAPPYGPKIFQALPGTAGVAILGGELVGEPATICLRVDSARDVVVEGTEFSGCRDGIWVGGNGKSQRVRLSWVRGSGFHRNGLSIVNAIGVMIEHCIIRDCELMANPGAGLDVEPNRDESVHDFLMHSCLFANCHVGAFIQPGKGLPGTDYVIVRNAFEDCSTYGLVVNSVRGAEIARNVVRGSLGAPAGGIGGVSIGGATLATIAQDITFTRNLVEASRPLVVAGASGRFFGNTMPYGSPSYPALGLVSGEVR